MSNEETKDKGLRRALRAQPIPDLPSNFAYRLMRQVEAEAERREQRAEQRQFWAVVAASVLLVAGVAAGGYLCWGKELREAFVYAGTLFTPVCVFPFIIVVVACLMLALDSYLRRLYYRRFT